MQKNNDQKDISGTEVTDSPNKLVLHREAALPADNDNKMLAWIAGLCAFAGIGMGFGAGVSVGAMLQQQNTRCHFTHSAATLHASHTTLHSQSRNQTPQITWLGVEGYTQQGATGAKIVRVFPNSPAQAAGLSAGDVVVSIDGNPIRRFQDLKRAVQAQATGEEINIRFLKRPVFSSRPASISNVNTEMVHTKATLASLSEKRFFQLSRKLSR